MSVVSARQITKWADEAEAGNAEAGNAEAGNDVETLKGRARGRPGGGAEPMQVVAVPLTAEELDALDAAALKHEMSRSEAIRAAPARQRATADPRRQKATAQANTGGPKVGEWPWRSATRHRHRPPPAGAYPLTP
jgi:hypothetical protein